MFFCIVSIPQCYEYDIRKYYTIVNLTQLNFFIIDIYVRLVDWYRSYRVTTPCAPRP
jgi:hypothetical protein